MAPTWEEEDQVRLEPPEGSPEDGIAPDLVFLKVPDAGAEIRRTSYSRTPGAG